MKFYFFQGCCRSNWFTQTTSTTQRRGIKTFEQAIWIPGDWKDKNCEETCSSGTRFGHQVTRSDENKKSIGW